MNSKNLRLIFLVAIFFVGILLWGKWQAAYAPKPVPQKTAQITQASDSSISSTVPNLSAVSESTATAAHATASTAPNLNSEPAAPAADAAKIVTVKTDVLGLNIGLTGGNIVEAQLLKYPKKLHSKTPFTLLTNNKENHYVTQSGLIGKFMPKKPLQYTASQSVYNLGDQDKTEVVLTATPERGVKLEKIYTVSKNSYQISVKYKVVNNTAEPIHARFFGQLLRTKLKKKHSLLMAYTTFSGGVLSSPEDDYNKQTYKDMRESPMRISSVGGWAAMAQHYFISAWIPNQKTDNTLYTNMVGSGLYRSGMAMPTVTIAAGATQNLSAKLYIGPAITKRLDAAAPHLGLIVDYGWLWFIGKIIFWVLSLIHHYIGNWGWAIIITTLLIKMLFHPLSAKSYKSMAKMRLVQPKINSLKERCGDDKQKLGRETMALYKKEGVNPLGGCLPMMVQIPVFIALYWVLMASVELRQAPFIFWIHDLAARDPYFILPLLMGASMFVQMKLNPSPPDPTQAKIMMMMPIVFTVMFLMFPAGLVLYWLVNNLVSIGQQTYIMKKVLKNPKKYK
jgi:YidC/Oxa1 family membrane protein insertase